MYAKTRVFFEFVDCACVMHGSCSFDDLLCLKALDPKTFVEIEKVNDLLKNITTTRNVYTVVSEHVKHTDVVDCLNFFIFSLAETVKIDKTRTNTVKNRSSYRLV